MKLNSGDYTERIKVTKRKLKLIDNQLNDIDVRIKNLSIERRKLEKVKRLI
jgi:hypothetical protein